MTLSEILAQSMALERPLTFFDLETTGVNPVQDRIVQIAGLTIFPDGQSETFNYLVNPGRAIPEEAQQVHGISDEDVANEPLFEQLAGYLYEKHFRGCDLGGYNIIKFDIPFLREALARHGIALDSDYYVVDCYQIFKRREGRSLAAAFKFYTGSELQNAHDALADVIATAAVLCGQYERYSDLSKTPAGLSEELGIAPDQSVDGTGRFFWNEDGEVTFGFGKHKGETVRSIARNNPGYLRWFLEKDDFPMQAREILQNALKGEFPKKDE